MGALHYGKNPIGSVSGISVASVRAQRMIRSVIGRRCMTPPLSNISGGTRSLARYSGIARTRWCVATLVQAHGRGYQEARYKHAAVATKEISRVVNCTQLG